MTRTKQLYELQQIDLELEAKREALQQLESQLGEDPLVLAAQRAVEEKKQLLNTLKKEQREKERQIDDIQARVSPEEKKLYDGSVRNPKELGSLQKKVTLLKEQKAKTEDEVLEIMSRIEEAQREVEVKGGDVEDLVRRWQESQERLRQEIAELQALLAEGEKQRGAVTAALDSSSLELYETLRAKKQGRAVARVEQGRCQGCRLTLPLNDLQQARTPGQLAQCSSCGRILYLAV